MRGFVSICSLVAFGACDGAFDLVRVTPPDGGAADADDGDASATSICLEDDFSGTDLDPARWTIYGGSAGVVSRISSGLAEIAVPAATTSAQDPYGGFSTKRGTFIGTASQVELVQVAPGAVSDFVIELTIDNGNHYNFTVSDGELEFGKVSASTPSVTTVVYSATKHRLLRMRHDTATNEMVFEAAAAASPFVELGRTAANVSLADAYFEIYAGSYDVAPAFVTKVDNVVITGTCAL